MGASTIWLIPGSNPGGAKYGPAGDARDPGRP